MCTVYDCSASFSTVLPEPSAFSGFFSLFLFFYAKPRRLDVNTVLMGKRFEEEASLTSALRWADERKQAQKEAPVFRKNFEEFQVMRQH